MLAPARPSTWRNVGGSGQRARSAADHEGRQAWTYDVSPGVDLREERVVTVDGLVDLLVVVSGPADEQRRVVVRVLELELEAVGDHLKLARVGLALERDGVRQLANGAVLVLPVGARSR